MCLYEKSYTIYGKGLCFVTMRKLYKTVNVASECDGEEMKFWLDYYVLEKEVEIEGFSVNTYGIEICKRAKRENGSSYFEYRKIFDIFCTEEETTSVIDKLARNSVTPICMQEVLEDLIGTGDFVSEEVLVEAV